MAAGAATELKNQYENRTSGWLGVILKNHEGKFEGVAIEPGDTVWMDEDERVATANAHRNPNDNPFQNGSLIKIAEGRAIRTHRPIDAPTAEEVDGPPAPAEEPPAGPGVPQEERPPDAPEPEPETPEPGAETGSTIEPSRPAEGVRQEGEEVGEPDAQEKAAAAQAAKAPTAREPISSAPPGGDREATREPVATRGGGGR